MKKIGVVTFFRGNYGSALQCYALSESIKKMGYQVVALEEKYERISRIFHNFNRKIKLFFYFINKPTERKLYLKFQKSTVDTNKLVSKKSIKMINDFINLHLNVESRSVRQHKKRVASEEFVSVIAGSDQIWNCSKGFVNSFFFLNFCPDYKKVCFAPSLGNGNFVKSVEKNFLKHISKFKYLSSREEEGSAYIDRLLGKKCCETLLDPVFLFDEKDLLAICSKSSVEYKNYYFVHFLNKPTNLAIECIEKSFDLESDVLWIIFANKHENLSFLKNAIFVDGGPNDYVKLIRNANNVFTDSFHSISFSILNHTNFIAFDRNYSHGISQSYRITNVLKKFGYLDRYVVSVKSFENIHFSTKNIENIKRNENIKQIEYLKKAIGECI